MKGKARVFYCGFSPIEQKSIAWKIKMKEWNRNYLILEFVFALVAESIHLTLENSGLNYVKYVFLDLIDKLLIQFVF